MSDFPGGVTSYGEPNDSEFLGSVASGRTLGGYIRDFGNDLEALMTKLGIAASVPTTAGDVLHVTGSGQTAYGPRSMVRLAEVTLASPASEILFTNIPQTYRHLILESIFFASVGVTNAQMQWSSDGSTFDSGGNYDYQTLYAVAAAASGGEIFAGTSFLAGRCSVSPITSMSVMNIANYAQAGYDKSYLVNYVQKSGVASGNMGMIVVGGAWRNTSAIRGIRLFPLVNAFAANTRVTLYGLPV